MSRFTIETCGLTDVINQDPTNLNQLFQALLARPIDQQPTDRSLQPTIDTTSQQPINSSRSEPPIDGQMVLAGLAEIIAISSNYFGALAQGNYWRMRTNHH